MRTNMKKCKHENISLEGKKFVDAYRNKDGSWEYDHDSEWMPSVNSKTYAYCQDCERFLTKSEVEELGV